MGKKLAWIVLACGWAWPLAASAPTAAQQAAVKSSLNPTVTPNPLGTVSHLQSSDTNIDQQGNRMFGVAHTPAAQDSHPSFSSATPTAEFLPLARDLRDLEVKVKASGDNGLISRSLQQKMTARIGVLKIKYGIYSQPNGAGLTQAQLKHLKAELAGMWKDLNH